MHREPAPQLLPRRGPDHAQAQPGGRVRRESGAVVLHRQSVAQPARPEGDGHRAPLPIPEGVLEGVGDQLVDHQGRRRGGVRVQRRVVPPDLDGHVPAAGNQGAQIVLERFQQLEAVDGPVPILLFGQYIIDGGD